MKRNGYNVRCQGRIPLLLSLWAPLANPKTILDFKGGVFVVKKSLSNWYQTMHRRYPGWFMKLDARVMAIMAMLIALQIILSRIFTINLGDTLRINFGFVPNAVAGMLLGPVPAMIVAGLSDLMGAVLFPSGPLYLGFTLTAMMGGLFYGVFFYQKEFTLKRAMVCKMVAMLVCNILMNTLWLKLMYGQAFFALLPSRLIKNLIQYPLDVALLYGLARAMRQVPAVLQPKT